MKNLKSRLPAPGTLIAIVALIVAMTGTAIAATHIRGNSIGSRKLKTVTVRTATSEAFGGQAEHNAIPAHKTAVVSCAPGEVAMSGGLAWNISTDGRALYTSQVVPIVTAAEPTGYSITGASDENPVGGEVISFTAYAECLAK